ncbi:GM19197 [Drosophila sechellia]|uniref:GM19197 n=1 Tax=Drosophila sechellia TaxID=7238 RepID=B4I9P2_DROSE|nr:GM19197 [Drosophila sechellia]
MPSATFVLEHLMAAQSRLDEQAASAAEVKPTSTISTSSTTVATKAIKVKSYEKKLLLALKKIVQ